MKTNEALEAVHEASLSVACLLDDIATDENNDIKVYELQKDIEHIQNKITTIETYFERFDKEYDKSKVLYRTDTSEVLNKEMENVLSGAVRADEIYIFTKADVTRLTLVFNTLQATDKPTGNLLADVFHNAYCGQV